MAELAVNDLALRLAGNEILKAVSLTVPAGRVLALLGPSGSGKTTLLRAVAGLAAPHRGSIRVGETAIYDAAKSLDVPAEKRGLGLMFQSYALWPHRTVAANVTYGLTLRNASKDDIKARLDKTLVQLGLADLAGRLPAPAVRRRAAAGGARPRAHLRAGGPPARRAAVEPRRQAARRGAHLAAPARRFAQRPHAAGTHDQMEAMAIADRVALLDAGLIAQEETPSDLYQEPANLFAAEFMGSNNRLDGTLTELSDKKAVIEVMGLRLKGVARGRPAIGDKATGVIRVEKWAAGRARTACR
jgi:iron(III) transport system ATP-binding protein